MSCDESLLAKLDEAIQEAARLNEKGRAGLEKALGAAIGYGPVEGNYRYAFAKRILLSDPDLWYRLFVKSWRLDLI